jgi:hypothetical protein
MFPCSAWTSYLLQMHHVNFGACKSSSSFDTTPPVDFAISSCGSDGSQTHVVPVKCISTCQEVWHREYRSRHISTPRQPFAGTRDTNQGKSSDQPTANLQTFQRCTTSAATREDAATTEAPTCHRSRHDITGATVLRQPRCDGLCSWPGVAADHVTDVTSTEAFVELLSIKAWLVSSDT